MFYELEYDKDYILEGILLCLGNTQSCIKETSKKKKWKCKIKSDREDNVDC